MADAVRIDPSLINFPGGPRDAAWWSRYTPIWLDVEIDEAGIVSLIPNGKRADGVVLDVTPALRRSRLKAAEQWVAQHPAFARAAV
jgi:hypothetical protein